MILSAILTIQPLHFVKRIVTPVPTKQIGTALKADVYTSVLQMREPLLKRHLHCANLRVYSVGRT